MALAVAVGRRQPSRGTPTAADDVDERPWPTADIATPFTAYTTDPFTPLDCADLDLHIGTALMSTDRVALAHAQRMWMFQATGYGVLAPTSEWLAAIIADGRILATARFDEGDPGTLVCMEALPPEMADDLHAFQPGDQLLSVSWGPDWESGYFRRHGDQVMPLYGAPQTTFQGAQPYDTFRALLAAFARCAVDDCDVVIPTPIAPLPYHPPRTPTPEPTVEPASQLGINIVRVDDIGSTWQVAGVTRTTPGRFIVVEIVIHNGNAEPFALDELPTVGTSAGSGLAALSDVAGLLPHGPECLLTPIEPFGQLRCALAFELPQDGHAPVLERTFGRGAYHETIELRLASEGYPASIP